MSDALGIGFTTTLAVMGAPEHPLAVGVMVNVTVIGAFVALVNDPLMLVPVPNDPMVPVTLAVLFLVQV